MADKIKSGSDAEKLEPNERREFLKTALKWTGRVIAAGVSAKVLGAIAAGVSAKVLGVSEVLASDSTEQDIIDGLLSGKVVFEDNETLIKYMENKGLSQETQEKLILELCYEVTPRQKIFLKNVRSRTEYFKTKGLDRTSLFKYMLKNKFPKEIIRPFCNEIFPSKHKITLNPEGLAEIRKAMVRWADKKSKNE